MHGRYERLGTAPERGHDSNAVSLSITQLSDDMLCVSLPSEDHSVARVAELTRAERAVVVLALLGHTNSSIALQRGSTPRTVANQLASVYRKLGISGRRELAAAVG